jgi:hypothetical protein
MKRAWDIEKFVVMIKEFSLVNQTTKQNEAGKPCFEFEIKDSKGVEWELMYDAKSGKISERENEVSSVDDEAFKKNLKVTEKKR